MRDRLCKSENLQQVLLSRNLDKYKRMSLLNESIIIKRGLYLNILPIMISGDNFHMA